MPPALSLFSSDLLWAPLPLFLLQILLILLVVRYLGQLLRLLRQPQVLGEILAGVLLGPSVAGYIPGFTATIFPESSQTFLTLFSSVGLCFFMFFLGLEVDPVFMLQSWRTTLPIALVSLSIPFGVGVGVGSFLFTLEENAPTNRVAFVLFIGTVFSFSAFPVLARILESSKLITSPVGIQALGLAAFEDVSAWCILALIISYANSPTSTPLPGGADGNNDGTSPWNSVLIFLVLVAFIAVLMLIVRPILAWQYKRKLENGEDLSSTFIPALLFGFLVASWFTEVLGVHAFFGAFLFGAILPKDGPLIPVLAPKIELLIVHVFLPIYFASSGMKTELQRLDSLRIWAYTLMVIAAASLTKIAAVTLSSKLVLSIRKERIKIFLAEEEDDEESESEESEEEEDMHAQHTSRYLPYMQPQPGRPVINSRSALVGGSEDDRNGDDDDQQQAEDDLSESEGHLTPSLDYFSDDGSRSPLPQQQQRMAPRRKRASVRKIFVARGGSGSPAGSQHALSTSSPSSGSLIGASNGTPPPSLVHDGSHSNRTHSVPGALPEQTISSEDRDEFGLDIHTGLPLVSDDQNLIEEFAMNTWTHCFALGVLLNSRGLVALIVLNIGLDKQVIGPRIFSLMLTMALVCTCLTSPLVYALYGGRWQKALLKMQVRDAALLAAEEEERENEQLREKLAEMLRDHQTGHAQEAEAAAHANLAHLAERNRLREVANKQADAVNAEAAAAAAGGSNALGAPAPAPAILAQPLLHPQDSPISPTLAPADSPDASAPSVNAVSYPIPTANSSAANSAHNSLGGSHGSLARNKARSATMVQGLAVTPGSSYIPPNLARMLSVDAESPDSAASSLDDRLPVGTTLGFGGGAAGGAGGMHTRSSSQAVGASSRFGAPQLHSAAGSSGSTGGISGMESPRSLRSPNQGPSAAPPMLSSSPGLQRRTSVFNLVSVAPVLGSTPGGSGIEGHRSISTRNLFAHVGSPAAQQSVQTQMGFMPPPSVRNRSRTHSRADSAFSGYDTPTRRGNGGGGSATPRRGGGDVTPRTGGGGGAFSFMAGGGGGASGAGGAGMPAAPPAASSSRAVSVRKDRSARMTAPMLGKSFSPAQGSSWVPQPLAGAAAAQPQAVAVATAPSAPTQPAAAQPPREQA